MNIEEELEEVEIDKSELLMKLAIFQQNFEKIEKLLKNEFLGKSMISYLMKKKMNKITQRLTSNKETAFFLTLYSQQFERAFAIARELNDSKKYLLLGEKAEKMGNFGLSEICYQLSDQKGKLMNTYLLTGKQKELKSIQFEDINYKFQQTLFTGDIKERVKLLAESGQVTLAYATAKIHGLEEFVDALQGAIPNIDEKVKYKVKNRVLLQPQKPLLNNSNNNIFDNWPLQEKQQQKVEQEVFSVDQSESEEEFTNEKMYKKTIAEVKVHKKVQKQQKIEVNEVEEDAWGVDDNLDLSDDSADMDKENIVQNSKIAWEHFVVGDKEGGLSLLKQQIGLINSQEIDKYIQELSNMGMGIIGDNLPNRYDINYFKQKYNEIMEYSSQAKLKQALDSIKKLMRMKIFLKIENDQQYKDLLSMSERLVNYKIAFHAKIKNDLEKNLQRKAELSMIMAMSQLESTHSLLILKIAINNLYKLGQFEDVQIVGEKYLQIYDNFDNLGKAQNIKKMKKIMLSALKKGKNKYSLDVQQQDLIDTEWYRRVDEELNIHKKGTLHSCLLDSYSSSKKGEICKFCNLCEIGTIGDGLKLIQLQMNYKQIQVEGEQLEILTIYTINKVLLFVTDCNIILNIVNQDNTVFGYTDDLEDIETFCQILKEKLKIDKKVVFFWGVKKLPFKKIQTEIINALSN